MPLSVVLVLPLVSLGWLAFAGALVATLIAVYFISVMGHGTYMDLGRNPQGHLDEPERPISWLLGPEKQGWSARQRLHHNFCGLLLKGAMLGTFVAVPLVIVARDPAYIVFMFSAASMPLCYLVAWNIPSRIKNFEQGPALAEALYGGVLGAAAALPVSS